MHSQDQMTGRVLGYLRHLVDGEDDSAALIVAQLPAADRVMFIERLGRLSANLLQSPDSVALLETLFDAFMVQVRADGS